MLTQKDVVTIAALIQSLTQHLSPFSDTPRLDTELLIAHAAERSRSFLYAYPEYQLDPSVLCALDELIKRRSQGEPIAYLLGKQEFWSLELSVTRDTLIPRPETEHLIEWALQNLPHDSLTIADLGTGSGAIAIALASERPHWQIHATDTSASALHVAINNAKQHRLNNIEFYLGSWGDALPQQHYAAIFSNPPYIAEDDHHLRKLQYEPISALRAFENGLSEFKQIIRDAKKLLQPGGQLILEHGYDQSQALNELLTAAGFTDICHHHDLSQNTRFTVACQTTTG